MTDDRPELSAWTLRNIYGLVALALATGAGFIAMGSFGTVQEGAKAELGLSDYAVSVVTGVSAAVPLALLSIPIGILVDRFARVRLLILLAALWTAGTLLTALASDAQILFVARMMTATGTTGGLTAALSLSADLCRPEQRGRATLVVTLGQRVGIAAAFGLAGWLFGQFVHDTIGGFGHAAPWRRVHIALAFVVGAMSLPLLFMREPERNEVESDTHAPFGVVFRELWARRAFLIPLFAGQIGVVMADTAAAVWAPAVLSRNYGQHPQDFAGWLGLLIFGTGILGAVLGGVSADLGQKSARRGRILLGAVIAAGISIPAGLFPIMSGVTTLAVILGVLITCGTITGIVVAIALTVLLPNEVRGLCIGLFIAIAGLIGYGLAPGMVVWVSIRLGGEQHLGTALAIVATVVSTLSFLAFAQAMRRAPVSATHAKPV
jgi:MFS family permease